MTDSNLGISIVESKIITIIRTFAMVLIILCHYCDYFERVEFLSQLFNVGVPIFFIISGFLYGQKQINNVKKWYIKQFAKIVIPLYTYYLVSALVLLALGKLGKVNMLDSIKVLLNLQGLVGGKLGNVQSGHLWFITFILICYLITPALQLLRGRINLIKISILCGALSIIWIAIILSINDFYFITWVPGILCYIFAYFLSTFWQRNHNKLRIWIGITLPMIALIALRFFINRTLTGDANIMNLLYGRVIVPYSQCTLGIWIFFTIYYVCLHYNTLTEKTSSALRVFDKYSYSIYIVHYMFVEGVLSLSHFIENKIIMTIAFVLLTLLYSILLKKISSLELNLVNRKCSL